MCLSLKQSHLGDSGIRVCIIMWQAKRGQDELAEIIVIRRCDVALFPRVKVGIRAEARRVFCLRFVRNGRHLACLFLMHLCRQSRMVEHATFTCQSWHDVGAIHRQPLSTLFPLLISQLPAYLEHSVSPELTIENEHQSLSLEEACYVLSFCSSTCICVLHVCDYDPPSVKVLMNVLAIQRHNSPGPEMYPRRAQKYHISMDKFPKVLCISIHMRYILLHAEMAETGRKDSLGKITPSLPTAKRIPLAVDHSVYALSTIQLPKHLAFLT
jgi:hypothetical protein